MWNACHQEPRKSYYLFLRRDYSCTAADALCKVRRIDTMIAGLSGPRRSWRGRLVAMLRKWRPGSRCPRQAQPMTRGYAREL